MAEGYNHLGFKVPVNPNHSVVTHQPSPLSLWFWGDSLPGYAMAFTILLAFSREDVCGH